VNALVSGAVERAHGLLGIDASDPRTSAYPFFLPHDLADEVGSGSVLHALLAAWAVGAVLVSMRRRACPDLVLYTGALAAAFVLFCASIRWQIPNNRLLLPLLVLGAPVIGCLLDEASRWLSALVLAALLASAPVPVLFSSSRPLVGARSVLTTDRVEQRFARRPELCEPYRRACERVLARGHASVGLVLQDWEISYEDPFWTLLAPAHARIENVRVGNASARLAAASPLGPFRPTAILVVRSSPQEPRFDATMAIDGATFARTWEEGPVAVFERAGASSRARAGSR
jgi:hypothetical protein